MKRAATWPVIAATFALLCGAVQVWPHDVRAAPETPAGPEGSPGTGESVQPKTDIPQELLLPKDEPDKAADRRELLEQLYERLSKSRDGDEAKVVSSAIEKLWLRSGSDTVDLLMARTAKLMQEEDFDLALEILDSVVEIAPDYPEGWTRRAAAHFVKKDLGRSLDDLRHALALDPQHYKAIQGLALLMQEMGEKEAALRAFRELLKIHPHLDEAVQAVRELSREVEGQGI